ncbi:hypothetical protein JHS3_28740 [Jeongeupia sp. HS-3]|uniref:Hpt domain-containing protein n=1 Tax=Jeongeupia sp. HS-3 TaxID=1009682 RepID=UPI0018A4068B|nr:Hpt domain-containing protein [Jeongeupia sp. HS-3]BCL77138.1 hypothetical protein JHS3_28740 [Jeongeupia sp. HS-3]
MSVHTEFDRGSLVWVKSEIEQTLTRAADALNQYCNEPDAALLKHAQTHLHQGFGALQMVELEGLARFCEEIEQLVAKVAAGEAGDDALQYAQAAIQDTTRFLERISAGAPNVPLYLAPRFAELAASRSGSASAAELFFPRLGELTLPAGLPARTVAASEWHDFVRQQRSRYESGLLRWIRGDAAAAPLMTRALAELASAQPAGLARVFWWSAAAVTEALPAQSDVDLKQLLMRLNLQLRRLADGSAKVAERLFRDLLYVLTATDAAGPLAQHLRQAFELDALLPGGSASADLSPESEALLRQAAALRDELGTAREIWSRTAAGQHERLPSLQTELSRLAGASVSLGIHGLPQLWDAMQSACRRYADTGVVESDALEMATALLLVDNALANYPRQASDFPEQVEAMLARLAEPGRDGDVPHLDAVSQLAQERLLRAQLAHEMRSNLRHVEDVLDGYFRAPQSRDGLLELEPVLRQTLGALAMLECDDAVRLLEACRQRIADDAQSDELPEQGGLEALAEAFSSLGFYIDALESGRADRDRLIAPSLARLCGEVQLAAAPVEEVLEAEVPLAAVVAVAPASPEVKPLPQTDDAIDAELLDVYLEEAVEVLATIAGQLERSRIAPSDRDAMTVIRRGFHTLKGSGRMVGLMHLGDVAWAIEQVMNKWLQDEVPASGALLALVADAHDAFAGWVRELGETGSAHVAADALIARAEALRLGAQLPTVSEALAIAPVAAEVAPLDGAGDEVQIGDVSVSASLFALFRDEAQRYIETLQEGQRALRHGEPLAANVELAAHTLGGIASTAGLRPMGELAYAIENALQALDLQLAFHADAVDDAIDFLGGMLDSVTALRAPADPAAPLAALTALRDAQLTVALAGPVAEMVPVADADLGDLPLLDAEGLSLPGLADDDGADLLMLDGVETADVSEVAFDALGVEPLVADAGAHEHDELFALDLDGLLDEIVVPAIDASGIADDALEPMDVPLAIEAMPALDTPSFDEITLSFDENGNALALADGGAADTVGIDLSSLDGGEPDCNDAPPLPALVTEPVSTEGVDPDALKADLPSFDEFELHFDDEDESSASFDVGTAAASADMAELPLDRLGETEPCLTADDIAPGGFADDERTEPVSAVEPELSIMLDTDEVSLDAELATAIDVELAEALYGEPLATPAKPDVANEARSPFETLLAGTAPGVPRDELEISVVDDIDEQLLPVFIEEADELLPQLVAQLRVLRDAPDDSAAAAVLKRVLHTLKGSARMSGAMHLGEAVHRMESRLLAASGTPTSPLLDELDNDYDLIVSLYDTLCGRGQPAAAQVQAQAAAVPQFLLGAAEADAKTTIRVKSELVDQLVNQAGEVAIARSRIEAEMLSLKGSLLELTENVGRLRSQLRELEIQAESQMQARSREIEDSHGNFDPLEFDRFTRLQEVTRFIAESVNDVATIQHGLLKNLDDSAGALTAQGRMTRELQQSLMRVRMVPFASVSDRLYRLVRQTGKEVGKKVNLELKGGRVEIDRGVLEKMISPFEHMLRNAIDHGLETSDTRLAAGKSEFGEVLVEVRQEGNELVLVLKDDGRGLDFERIRAKAEALGLVAANGDMSEAALAQLIFEPGFTTASNVTQLSGRGIGMDVVKNEISNLGGSIEVSSTAGLGTRFTIYLPLTLAVTQVLLVKAGERKLAIPSVMIEQVQELKQGPLADLYEAQSQSWMGASYPFAYFPRLLGDADTVPEQKRFSTVLLLRAGAARMALHVDALIKNQEVVVKAIGPQLARVPGVAGATVLGNGDIVPIMNPIALLARGVTAASGQRAVAVPEKLETAPVVMVVDDSLTVRKITSRLLAREGFQVVTAKDGVDALQQLQDVTPAVMLVDVEMPRMDGFELTRNVRNNEGTRTTPIVMITSRTADKHKNYAFELGVDVFLGKPYQEDELLGHIRRLIALATV